MTTETQSHAPHTAGHTIRWWAPLYSLVASLTGLPKVYRSAIKFASLQPGESVLDVGCGPGAMTLRAMGKVGATGRVVGIDASPEMIAQAQKNAAKRRRQVDFRVATIEEMPFPEGEFDVVLSSFMLHHLPDDLKDRGIADVWRVLKPGGRFIAVDLAPGRGLRGRFTKLIGHRMPDDYGEQLRDRMTSAGFQDVELVKKPDHSAVYLRAKR